MNPVVKDEAWVKKQIKIFLKGNNIYFFMPSASMYSKAGIPDFVCCYKGRLVGIEAKGTGGKPTPLQEVEHIRWTNAGALVLVITPNNLSDLTRILTEC